MKFLPLTPNSPNADYKGSVYQLPDNSLVLPDLTKYDILEGLKRSKKSVSKDDLV